MIRIMVVDDNAVIRRGVTALLAEAEDIRVVAEAGNGQEALAQAEANELDVILLDVRMPVLDGLSVVGRLAERARVMMLTYTEDESDVVAAIKAGASGYLIHGQFEADELVERIRQLKSGDTVLSPKVVGTVFEALRRTAGAASEADGPASLTAREQEIMHLISQGLTNGQIAERFVLSEKTVKNHVNRIYAKLGASNRAQATAIWLGTAVR